LASSGSRSKVEITPTSAPRSVARTRDECDRDACARPLRRRAGSERGLREDRILPLVTDEGTAVRVAVAAGGAACAEGLARAPKDEAARGREARRAIGEARAQLDALVAAGLVRLPEQAAR
jgi:hypothetical protein